MISLLAHFFLLLIAVLSLGISLGISMICLRLPSVRQDDFALKASVVLFSVGSIVSLIGILSSLSLIRVEQLSIDVVDYHRILFIDSLLTVGAAMAIGTGLGVFSASLVEGKAEGV